MNFRPTKQKLIGSIIISIVLLIISAENIVLKQQCNPGSVYIYNRCPSWTTAIMVSLGLVIFSLIFISTYIIWSLIQKINHEAKKRTIIESVIISLIFFNLNFLVEVSRILGRLGLDGFSRRIEISSSDFYSSVFSSLIFMIIWYTILYFVIYNLLRIIKKHKFLKLNFKKLILTLAIIFPIIFSLFSIFLKSKLLPAKFLFLNQWIIISNEVFYFPLSFFYALHPGASFMFFIAVFTFLILTFVYYIISCFIIFYWNKLIQKKSIEIIILSILAFLLLGLFIFWPLVSCYFIALEKNTTNAIYKNNIACGEKIILQELIIKNNSIFPIDYSLPDITACTNSSPSIWYELMYVAESPRIIKNIDKNNKNVIRIKPKAKIKIYLQRFGRGLNGLTMDVCGRANVKDLELLGGFDEILLISNVGFNNDDYCSEIIKENITNAEKIKIIK